MEYRYEDQAAPPFVDMGSVFGGYGARHLPPPPNYIYYNDEDFLAPHFDLNYAAEPLDPLCPLHLDEAGTQVMNPAPITGENLTTHDEEEAPRLQSAATNPVGDTMSESLVPSVPKFTCDQARRNRLKRVHIMRVRRSHKPTEAMKKKPTGGLTARPKRTAEEMKRRNRESVQRCRARKREKTRTKQRESASYDLENARIRECMMESMAEMEKDLLSLKKNNDMAVRNIVLKADVRKMLGDVLARTKAKKYETGR